MMADSPQERTESTLIHFRFIQLFDDLNGKSSARAMYARNQAATEQNLWDSGSQEE